MKSALSHMSWNALSAVGITSPEALSHRDPFEVYAALHRMRLTRSPSLLYRLIAESEGASWQEIATRRGPEIAHRLGQMELRGK